MPQRIGFTKTKGPADTFTAREACRIFEISKSTLLRLEEKGKIPPASSRKGRTRARAYSWNDLEAIAKALNMTIPETVEI